MKQRKSTDFVLLLLIIVLIGGFYLILNNLQGVRQAVSNVELNLEILSSEFRGTPETVMPSGDGEATSTPAEEGQVWEGGIVIPTAILFQTESSPLLSPTTLLTVAVEKVIKGEEGIVTLHIKTFTNRATSYSTFDPGNFFELLNPQGSNQKPLKVRGQFDSMPPQSAVEGEIIFKLQPSQIIVILQVDTNEGIKYYEINFITRTYKEAILG